MRDFANGRFLETGVVRADDGIVIDSRDLARHNEIENARRRKREPLPPEQITGYGFMNILDLNDRDRGLWWFADNAVGWQQAPDVSAQTVERRGAGR